MVDIPFKGKTSQKDESFCLVINWFTWLDALGFFNEEEQEQEKLED